MAVVVPGSAPSSKGGRISHAKPPASHAQQSLTRASNPADTSGPAEGVPRHCNRRNHYPDCQCHRFPKKSVRWTPDAQTQPASQGDTPIVPAHEANAAAKRAPRAAPVSKTVPEPAADARKRLYSEIVSNDPSCQFCSQGPQFGNCMVSCADCARWQHTRCVGLFRPPIRFFCTNCRPLLRTVKFKSIGRSAGLSVGRPNARANIGSFGRCARAVGCTPSRSPMQSVGSNQSAALSESPETALSALGITMLFSAKANHTEVTRDTVSTTSKNPQGNSSGCPCGKLRPRGFTISCFNCNGEFHGRCVGIHNKRDTPPKFYCPPCREACLGKLSNIPSKSSMAISSLDGEGCGVAAQGRKLQVVSALKSLQTSTALDVLQRTAAGDLNRPPSVGLLVIEGDVWDWSWTEELKAELAGQGIHIFGPHPTLESAFSAIHHTRYVFCLTRCPSSRPVFSLAFKYHI